MIRVLQVHLKPHLWENVCFTVLDEKVKYQKVFVMLCAIILAMMMKACVGVLSTPPEIIVLTPSSQLLFL